MFGSYCIQRLPLRQFHSPYPRQQQGRKGFIRFKAQLHPDLAIGLLPDQAQMGGLWQVCYEQAQAGAVAAQIGAKAGGRVGRSTS